MSKNANTEKQISNYGIQIQSKIPCLRNGQTELKSVNHFPLRNHAQCQGCCAYRLAAWRFRSSPVAYQKLPRRMLSRLFLHVYSYQKPSQKHDNKQTKMHNYFISALPDALLPKVWRAQQVSLKLSIFSKQSRHPRLCNVKTSFFINKNNRISLFPIHFYYWT